MDPPSHRLGADAAAMQGGVEKLVADGQRAQGQAMSHRALPYGAWHTLAC
jgi:hypothetical protein